MIKWKGGRVFLSEVLIGEPVGLFQRSDTIWIVKYGPLELGTMRGREGFCRPGSAQLRSAVRRSNETRNLSTMSSGSNVHHVSGGSRGVGARSEDRRVWKECVSQVRFRCAPYP